MRGKYLWISNEEVCGARLHSAYIIPGGVRFGVHDKLLTKILDFSYKFFNKINDFEDILNQNPIWVNRLKGIGQLPKSTLNKFSMSGPISRSSGLYYDVRKNFGYEVYPNIDFSIPLAQEGDSYSRFLVRFYEMKESIKIIIQCVFHIKNKTHSYIKNNFFYSLYKLNPITESNLSSLNRNMSMEIVINSFKEFSEGIQNTINLPTYLSTETPNRWIWCISRKF